MRRMIATLTGATAAALIVPALATATPANAQTAPTVQISHVAPAEFRRPR